MANGYETHRIVFCVWVYDTLVSEQFLLFNLNLHLRAHPSSHEP